MKSTKASPERNEERGPTTAALTTHAVTSSLPIRQRRVTVVAWIIIVVQALLALAVPIKNVVMITNPSFRLDAIESEKAPYRFAPTEPTKPNPPPRLYGTEIVALMHRVLDISFGNEQVREALHAAGRFDPDTIYPLLTPEEFDVISQYYGLVFQTYEMPGGVFTPRPRDANQPLEVYVRNTTHETQDWKLTLWCDQSERQLHGMKCWMDDGTQKIMCHTNPKPNEVRKYDFVNFTEAGFYEGDSGFQNNIGLLHLVDTFQTAMTRLFGFKNWKKTLEDLMVLNDTEKELAYVYPAFKDHETPYILDINGVLFGLSTLKSLPSPYLDSCVATEIVMSMFYTPAFVMDMVQGALEKHAIDGSGISRYEPFAVKYTKPSLTDAILEPMLRDFSIVLTSGARPSGVQVNATRVMSNTAVLTSITNATMGFKLDRKLNGETVYGSSLRMVLYMQIYPDLYSKAMVDTSTLEVNGETVEYQIQSYRILGALKSGLNTFKDDYWASTMQVYRLAEIPRWNYDENPSALSMDTWWDDEQKIANWFAQWESSDDAPFNLLNQFFQIVPAVAHLDDAPPETRCHRAFFKTLGKLVVLTMAQLSEPSSYLVFMSNVEGGFKAWAQTTARKLELYGENILGKRTASLYSLYSAGKRNSGSSWVMLPILEALLRAFPRSTVESTLLSVYNTSFATYISTEFGKVHFLESEHCFILQSTGANVTTGDTVGDVAAKLYPNIVQVVGQLLDQVPTMYGKLQAALTEQQIILAPIPVEMLLGIVGSPKEVGHRGSPLYWQATPISVGVLKLLPMRVPSPAIIEEYRNATRCYKTLELRYLNQSVRCWIEPNSIQRSRVAYSSELLRNLIFGNWAISVVLNLVSIGIAIVYIRRLIHAWKLTQFQCVNKTVALQLNFQGFGILSYSQLVLMALASVPLLFSLHLPRNPVFMPNYNAYEYSKLVKDVLIALCATWFVDLGFWTANEFMTMTQPSVWFNNYLLRILCIVLVFLLQLVTAEHPYDTNYQFGRLLMTIAVSLALGILMAMLPWLRRCMNRSNRAIVAYDNMVKEPTSVIRALQSSRLPLNKYGLIGYSRQGWSVTGLLMERWQLLHRTHGEEKEILLRRDACDIPLRADAQGQIDCLLK